MRVQVPSSFKDDDFLHLMAQNVVHRLLIMMIYII